MMKKKKPGRDYEIISPKRKARARHLAPLEAIDASRPSEIIARRRLPFTMAASAIEPGRKQRAEYYRQRNQRQRIEASARGA